MKVVIAGGSGQIGTILVRDMSSSGHNVIVLSRRAGNGPGRYVAWDGVSQGPWCDEVDGADVVINLAGRSVNCRYNPANREEILDSRVNSTQAIGQAISNAARPPRVWLQASSATIYAHTYDSPNDEANGVINPEIGPDAWRFSVAVVQAWEAAANTAIVPGTRKVLLRSAMTMSPDAGGVFDTFRGLAARGLGGTIGNGRQFVSWIHYVDFIRAVYWLIDNELDGAVNVASPNPVPNVDFMRGLRSACGVRFGLPTATWMLEIATRLLRTESELVLKSRRVVPTRLLESGFTFRFPAWAKAVNDLFQEQEPSESN